jgi:hypothetical protein
MSLSTSPTGRRLLAAAGTLALAAAAATGTAAGAPRTSVLGIYGSGSYTVAADGAATMSGPGTIQASPNVKVRDVEVTAVVAAADGTLPPRGECEAASATLAAGDTVLAAAGEVCGIIQTHPLAVPLHIFHGTFVITAGKPPLRDVEGTAEVHLTSTGHAWASAISR